MQSSNHSYLSNLDHLRAFAAYQVFCWHFLHLDGRPYFYEAFPPFGLLTQGHTGVAFFMTISGYIFAYLTYGKKVNIAKFWANRVLRLAPLMVFWFFFGTAFTEQRSPLSYFSYTWFHDHFLAIVDHNGYWSILIEFRYYLLFPALLWIIRRFGLKALLPALLVPMLCRAYLCDSDDCSMQLMSYWTLWGRADQFLLGTAALYLEKHLATKPNAKDIFSTAGKLGLFIIIAFYSWFNYSGGYSGYAGGFRGNDVWLVMPMIEGACYSAIIVWYLQLKIPDQINKVLSIVGKYSYSLYLGHPHFIQMTFAFIALHFGMPNNLYGRWVVSTLVAFPVMMAVSAITYRYIEMPFLKLRMNYLKPLQPQ